MVVPFGRVEHFPEIAAGVALFTVVWVVVKGLRRPRSSNPQLTGTAAYQRFMGSMAIDYARWHDGEPYDLDALASLGGEERDRVEALLIARKNCDWRDSDALDRLGSPAALAALDDSLRGPNREVRIRAGELLFTRGRLTDLDELLVEGIANGTFGDGLQQVLRLAAMHPSPGVVRALAQAALCRREEGAVHAVALLCFLHGLAAEPFDASQQDYFQQFRATPHGPERRALFDALCARIGIDGAGIDCPPQPAS
jgi:hypothetical protein